MPNYKRKFSKVYDKYIDKIYRFIFLKIGSRETAEDLTAQVFAKGWRKYSQGTDIKNLPAYLYQIARTEIADHYRRHSKFRIVPAEAVQIVDPNPGPEQSEQARSESDVLMRFLSQLSEDYQNVLVWRYIDGLSNKEIAAMTEKSEGAVRVMLHRALKELKAKMGDEQR